MVFAAIDPRRRVAGTPLENVAEEVLNGLFCHYEPPTSEFAQHKAANDAKLHPKKYTFSQVKKKQSILRTSRLHHRKSQAAEAARNKKKGVTWRDEQNRKGLEAKVEACTADCDFLGFSTKGGNGLADSLSPTQQKAAIHNTMKNPFPEPIIKQTSASTEPMKIEEPPKKVLYDDEGNPIAEETENIVDENSPPTIAFPSVHSSSVSVPPAPTGLSQLRKLAKGLDEGVYEPENYDQPRRPQSLAYKRIRSPPLRKSPRHNEVYGVEDKITMARSQSPSSNDIPNHYDIPEQFEDKNSFSSGRLTNRPGTPRRGRGEMSDDASMQNSVVDQGDDHKFISGSRHYKHHGSPKYYYETEQGQSIPVSPSRRSEVFSDLTVDEAISGRPDFRHRPVSPAMSSEGVEVDMFGGRGRPRSRSPSRYHDDPQFQVERESISRNESNRRPVQNNFGRQSPDLSKRSSRDSGSEKRRRRSVGVPANTDENLHVRDSEKSSRSTRTSEPLVVGSTPHKIPVKEEVQQLRKLPSRQATTAIETVQKKIPFKEELQQLRKLPSRQTTTAIETGYTSEDERSTAVKRDPTPRMSVEPTTVEDIKSPLPPTPRQKNVDHTSHRENKDTEADSRSRRRRSAREERVKEEELRSRLSRMREETKHNAQIPVVASSRPKSPQSGVVTSNANDWAYNALLQPFSPKSVATDDEIRAEVSSVGMESNTLRPIHYANPFVGMSQPSITEERKTDDAISRIGSEPSSLSNSTLSIHQKEPAIIKVKSVDTGRRSRDVSNASASIRTKKLWKGWRKAVGKVKAIVKDIDEQRIPVPFLTTTTVHANDLKPQHPAIFVQHHTHHPKSRVDRS